MTTAVVLSGGGSNGDYECGVIRRSVELGAFPDGIDIMIGTSIGAWTAAFMAQWNKADLHEAAAELERMWMETLGGSTSTVWKERWAWLPRPFRYASGLFNPSIGTNDPAKKLLHRMIDFGRVNSSDVIVAVNAVDLRKAKSMVWVTPDLDAEHVIASSAFPIAMPPEPISEAYCTDGGLTDMAMLAKAIDLGADRIVVISTRDPDNIQVADLGPDSDVPEIAMRLVDIAVMHMLDNDIKQCAKINEWLHEGWLQHPRYKPVELHVIKPKTPLGDSLDFTLEKVAPQIEQGKAEAELYWSSLPVPGASER